MGSHLSLRRRALRFVLVFCVAAAGLAAAAASPASAGPNSVRIMPLGDSITAGQGPSAPYTAGGYRFSLEDYLTASGYDFDFVGSVSSGVAPLVDLDHEGHGGFTIAQIDTNVAGWIGAANPDFVLLLAGTNDLTVALHDDAAARLGAVVDKILAARPGVRVIVSKIPPNTDFPAFADEFNLEIQSVIATRITAGKAVSLIDPAYAGTADLADQRHPNLTGYRKIGRAWFDELRLYLPAPTLTGSVQVSDMLEREDTNYGGVGPFRRDRSTGNNPLTLDGIVYPKGIGVHTADLYFDLRAHRFETFTATVGIDDEVGAGGSSAFAVFLDGVQVFNSGVMTGATPAKQISVPVAGKSTLRLLQTDGSTNGTIDDHGDWADAKLTLLPPPTAGTGGFFNAVTPKRIYDSRAATPIGARGTRNVTILGVGGIPATGVKAVALNVTVDRASAQSFVSVFPRDDSGAEPTTSNLNFVPGRPTPAMVFARPGLGGQASIYNAVGTVDVIVDVLGWFSEANGQGARYHSEGPSRCFDTRSTFNPPAPLTAGAAVAITFTGGQTTAATHRTAMMLNVTAANPTTSGYLTVFPIDRTQPVAATLPDSSNVNFVANQGAVANATIAKLRESNGDAGFYNSSGRTDVICDSFGYFDDGSAAAGPGQTLRILDAPKRVVDTRNGTAPAGSISTSKVTLSAGEARTVKIAGDPQSGVPGVGVSAGALNITIDRSRGAGFISAFPSTMSVAEGQRTSILNFGPNQTVPNFAIVPLGNGQITLFNGSNGAVDLLVDVFGYFVS